MPNNLLNTDQLNTLIDAVAENIGQTGDAAQSVIDALASAKGDNAESQAKIDAASAKLQEIVTSSQTVEDRLKDAVNPNTPPIVVEEPLPEVPPIDPPADGGVQPQSRRR